MSELSLRAEPLYGDAPENYDLQGHLKQRQLLGYYERELAFLRQMRATLRKYPQVASRLL
jgi:hypothetical protein